MTRTWSSLRRLRLTLANWQYCFGSTISHYDVGTEMALLERHIPPSFMFRDTVDMGCGDGRLGLRLRQVLKPSSLRSVDRSSALVRSARRRGLNAQMLDLERDTISGHIGILWGVLHHLRDPVHCLGRLSRSFSSLIIRESIGGIRWYELGDRFDRSRLYGILQDAGIHLPDCLVLDSQTTKAVIILTQHINREAGPKRNSLDTSAGYSAVRG